MNEASQTAPASTKRKAQLSFLEWCEALAFGWIIVALVFCFLFRVMLVSGSSMVPTLTNGDRLLVQSVGYQPKRGDIVIVDGYINYGKPLVKRVIAMEGDTVDIDYYTGEVFVNGQLLDEPYIAEPTTTPGDTFLPVTLGEDQIFVMGDNRNHSSDSRSSEIGLLDRRDILGKAIFRIAPLDTMGRIE